MKGYIMSEFDERQKDQFFQLMLCEAELKREIGLKEDEIEKMERDWLESLSLKYTKILSQYGLTFDELDDDEKYRLIAHEERCEDIAIHRGLIDEVTLEPFNDDEFIILEALAEIDFSSRKVA
jgi:hypothetical protein